MEKERIGVRDYYGRTFVFAWGAHAENGKLVETFMHGVEAERSGNVLNPMKMGGYYKSETFRYKDNTFDYKEHTVTNDKQYAFGLATHIHNMLLEASFAAEPSVRNWVQTCHLSVVQEERLTALESVYKDIFRKAGVMRPESEEVKGNGGRMRIEFVITTELLRAPGELEGRLVTLMHSAIEKAKEEVLI